MNDYITTDQIKPFLLHEDSLVRNSVVAYSRDAFSEDEDLVPLIIRACNQYGEIHNFTGLEAGRSFTQSYDSVALALELLERTQDESTILTLNDILAAMHAPLFLLWRDRLLRATNVHRRTLSVLWQRLSLVEQHTMRLWAALKHFMEEVRSEHCPDCINRTYSGNLVEALAPHDEPGSQTLIKRLERCTGKGDWGALFIIELLGKRRIKRAIPAIIDCFRFNSIHFGYAATEALIRIGDPEAIRLLTVRMPHEDEDFRHHAALTLTGFKHPEAEQALIDLLAIEDNPGLQTFYCQGLCCHYSKKGEDAIRRQINRVGSSLDGTILKTGILVTSLVRGLELPEEETWRDEIENYEVDEKDYYFEPVFEVMDDPNGNSTFRRDQPKVGRNQPCICGSGKKYKRCCDVD